MPRQGYDIDPAKLRAARESARLTPREVATAVGCSWGMYYMIERGKRRPGFALLAALERVLGVPASKLGASLPPALDKPPDAPAG